jgi:hypothetical protein
MSKFGSTTIPVPRSPTDRVIAFIIGEVMLIVPVAPWPPSKVAYINDGAPDLVGSN